jgi:hypothetical protein
MLGMSTDQASLFGVTDAVGNPRHVEASEKRARREIRDFASTRPGGGPRRRAKQIVGSIVGNGYSAAHIIRQSPPDS